MLLESQVQIRTTVISYVSKESCVFHIFVTYGKDTVTIGTPVDASRR